MPDSQTDKFVPTSEELELLAARRQAIVDQQVNDKRYARLAGQVPVSSWSPEDHAFMKNQLGVRMAEAQRRGQ